MKSKIKLIGVIILILHSFFLISQDIIVKYVQYENSEKKIDLNDRRYKKLPENIKNKLIQQSLIKYTDYFTLYHSKYKSKYIYDERKFESADEADFLPVLFTLNYYKDFLKKKIIMIADFVPDDYQVERTFDEISKELKQDTMTINGYLCKKAIINFLDDMKAVVWYTPDIPVPDGPSWFFGLPGLVLKVNIENTIITEAVNIEFPKNMLEIELPDRKKPISYKEYKKDYIFKWMSEYNNK